MSAIAGMTTAAPLCSQSSGMPVLNSLNGGVVSPLVMQQQPLPTSSPPAFIIQVSPSVSDSTNQPTAPVDDQRNIFATRNIFMGLKYGEICLALNFLLQVKFITMMANGAIKEKQ